MRVARFEVAINDSPIGFAPKIPKENCEIWEESGRSLIPNYSLYSDIAGYTAPHGGTIPPNILVTSLKPDLFIVNEREAKAILLELTVPWDANIQRSHEYKEGKYAALIADLWESDRGMPPVDFRTRN